MLKHYLITPKDKPAQVVILASHPCDKRAPRVLIPAVFNADGSILHSAVTKDLGPFYKGPKSDVIDIEEDPENPTWLAYCGFVSSGL